MKATAFCSDCEALPFLLEPVTKAHGRARKHLRSAGHSETGVVIYYSDVERCRFCGCTETTPCEGGCWWIAPDVCSSCADRLPKKSKTKKRSRR